MTKQSVFNKRCKVNYYLEDIIEIQAYLNSGKRNNILDRVFNMDTWSMKYAKLQELVEQLSN